jgi:hypothetical protein
VTKGEEAAEGFRAGGEEAEGAAAGAEAEGVV